MNKDLKREIEIKNKYLQMLIDIGYDYDGMDTVERIKKCYR